jgi:hypothetical protein
MLAQAPPRDLVRLGAPTTPTVSYSLIKHKPKYNNNLMPSVAVGAAAGIGIREAASRKRAAAPRNSAKMPREDIIPRCHETYIEFLKHVKLKMIEQPENKYLQQIHAALLEAVELPNSGPFEYGWLSGLDVPIALLYILARDHMAANPLEYTGVCWENEREFVNRMIKTIKMTINHTIPESAIKLSDDQHKFVIHEQQTGFALMRDDKFSKIIYNAEKNQLLILFRHIVTDYENKVPMNKASITRDKTIIDHTCSAVLESVLSSLNTIDKPELEITFFFTNRTAAGTIQKLLTSEIGEQFTVLSAAGKDPSTVLSQMASNFFQT